MYICNVQQKTNNMNTVDTPITTKQDVLNIYDKCMDFLKNNFPIYFDIVRKYRFTFGKRKKAYGVCDYRAKTISINMYLSQYCEKNDVQDTMLHEMAHAIDKGVNGYSSGHGRNWKKICYQIGCTAKCSKSKTNDVIKPSKFVLVVSFDDGYEYVSPVHRVTRKNPLNTIRKGGYLKNRKKETLDKLMTVTFEDFQNNQISTDKK